MTAVVSAPVRRSAGLPVPTRLGAAVTVVIAIGVAARLVGFATPLWFDETFSAVIASQPTFGDALAWCRDEIGGPGYYLLLWLWAQAFGTSAAALRSLSLLASLAASALIAWRGHPDRTVRWTWAALVLLWLPAIDHGSNARCYALATLIACAQAIAFLRLMRAPDLRRAAVWVGTSGLLMLVHVYGVAVAAAGGAVFVAVHRRRALACWPALLLLVPVAGWFAWQGPLLARFAAQGNAYRPFGLTDLLLAPSEFFDSPGIGLLLVALPVVTWLKSWRGEHTPADRALAASGLVALAALLIAALLTSAFAWRYAVPAAPALLFALALWARGLQSRFPKAPTYLVLLFAAAGLARGVGSVAELGHGFRDTFTFQRPAEWLAGEDAHHLAFLWEGPTSAMSDPRRIAEVAGYFPRLADPAVRVTVVEPTIGRSSAPTLAAALARDRSIDGLLWIADPTMPGVLAAPDAALLERRGWRCRDFGRAPIHLLTCRAPR